MGRKKLVRVRGQLVVVDVDATEADAVAEHEARELRQAVSLVVAAGLPASFEPSDPRPLLLIDVDGVVCPFGAATTDMELAGFSRELLDGYPVWLSDALGARLHRLAHSFQLVWCTAWQIQAARVIAPRLGLPAMPVILFDEQEEGDGHWKWAAIRTFVGTHPFAWLDDELRAADFAIAEASRSPCLLLAIDPCIGLADEHVTTLESFARSVGAER
jgi:hypothetical protein